MSAVSKSILDFGFWILDSRSKCVRPGVNPKSKIQNLKSARAAYTLVEMLVVVTIIIILVAATLPVAKKMMEGSQVREASRQFNSYWQMAKARALQTGRPCGIYFPMTSAPLGLTPEA